MRLILSLASLFLRGTALMFSLVGAITAVACWGGLFSDRLDALTHAAPIWLFCALAGLVLALAVCRDAERRALAGVAALGAIALLALMTPELLSTLRRPEKPPADPATVKIIQFNLWAKNHDQGATAAWILEQKADIVIAEEAGRDSRPVLKALAKAYPHQSRCPFRYGCDTRIYSRWPLGDQHNFYDDDDGLVGAWAVVRHPRGDFRVVGTHFVWPIPAGYWQHQSQTLARSLAPFAKDSLIVTGDFNSTPWSWGLRRQDQAFGLERRTRALASWPGGAFSRIATAPFPILPIDHVYAGKAWRTVKVERGPVLGSDHRPVIATLAR